MGAPPPSFLRAFATSFTNFVARYNAPLIIGLASLAALWSVSAIAVFGGAKLLQRVPMRSVNLAGVVALPGLGVFSLVRAIASLG